MISSIELTASAAIVIAALSIAFGSTAAMRVRVAIWLSGWFVLVVILAATRALYYEHGLGTPGLGLAVALPIALLCATVARVQFITRGFSAGAAVAVLRRAHGSSAGRHFCRSLRRPPSAGAIRSGCWLGRHLCRGDGCTGRLACVPTDHKCTGDCKDLEHHRHRGSDRRCRIGSYLFTWSCTFNFRRTKLGHYDNLAMALNSWVFGSAIVRGSHRDFRSTG